MGMGGLDDRASALKAGCDAVLVKPASLKEVGDLIEGWNVRRKSEYLLCR